MILATLVAGLVTSLPNILPTSVSHRLPDWLSPLHLGLDLRGGSHLLLEIDGDAMLRERLEAIVDAARTELRKERVAYTELGVADRRVLVAVRDVADREKTTRILRDQAIQLESGVFGIGGADITVKTLDDGRVVAELTEQAVKDRRAKALEQSIEIVRRRIDQTGTSEPVIQRQGESRIVVQLPGVDDPDRIKRLLGKTAKMTFRLVDTTVAAEDVVRGAARLPVGTELLDADERDRRTGAPVKYVVQRRVMVSGDTLTDSQPSFQDNQPVVTFRFDTAGARRFATATEQNVGKPFAIVLDGKVISAPVIREPIRGGAGIISGNFTVQSAKDLALLLRAGALPAPLKIIEERSVGPGLGADSIKAGSISAIIGLTLVVIFMFASYGPLFGGIANLALALNITLLIGILSAIQATLTLPGIAGIVLTMGMAVDANVLIYERVREELRTGKSPLAALDAGYSRAMATIIDSNLTTLIANLLLFFFGAGPVRGFAVTISIGIVTSVFTAVTVARLFTVIWYRRARPARLAI